MTTKAPRPSLRTSLKASGGIASRVGASPDGEKSSSSAEGTLRKDLGFLAAVSIVVGVVIGSGIFFKPGTVIRNAGSGSAALLAWVLGGLITLAAGLTIAELAAAIPKTGGLYIYMNEIYGDFWGFLLGWVQTVIYTPGSVAALAIVFATQASVLVPMGAITQKLLAIGVMALLLIFNIVGTKQGGIVQTVATVGKLIPIVAITVWGLLRGGAEATPAVLSPAISGATGLGAAILATLWAYDGWINVTNVAGEIRDPAKLLPRSIISGIGFVLIVYVLINVAFMRVVPPQALAASATPATEVANKLFGPMGSKLISASILVSIFGALNGYILTGARVPYAMSTRGLLPGSRYFGRLHPHYQTPASALILIGVLAVAYIITGSFDRLTTLSVFVLWVFFVMALFAVFILRARQPDLARPYRVPLYPLIPLIGIAGGLYILISTLVTSTQDAFLGIGIAIIGIPIYRVLHSKKDSNG